MENYHIPMIIYSPANVKPGVVDSVASQIDIPPTILALLNVSYKSTFFGQDILTEGQHHPRAFMSNYLAVGQEANGLLVGLHPKREIRVTDVQSGQKVPLEDARAKDAATDTIAIYQLASEMLKKGHR
jgi:arylsulfatase A-like enzyme